MGASVQKTNKQETGHRPYTFTATPSVTNPTADFTVKILLLGDYYSGKRSLRKSFMDTDTGDVDGEYMKKVLDFGHFTVQLTVVVNHHCHFRIYSERYYAYRATRIVFVCYDTTDTGSLDNVPHWFAEADKYCSGCIKVLVGTKCDREANRQVTWEAGAELAKQYQCRFYETSATSRNIQEIFLNSILQALHEEFQLEASPLRLEQNYQVSHVLLPILEYKWGPTYHSEIFPRFCMLLLGKTKRTTDKNHLWGTLPLEIQREILTFLVQLEVQVLRNIRENKILFPK